MKRKVIKQGNGTLTITLPKQWTGRAGLKGGDEIEVTEEEQELKISSFKVQSQKRISIDASKIRSDRGLKWTLAALYKTGFDEIELFIGNPAMMRRIQQHIKDFYVGFAVMEQSDRRIVLKSIAVDSYSELEPSLRRAFLVTISMAESILERMKKNDFENITDLLMLEMSNNQFTNFCERLLIKHGSFPSNKHCFKYLIVWNLESVCDELRNMCVRISEKPVKKVSPELARLFEESVRLLRRFYGLVYKYDPDEMDKTQSEEKDLNLRLRQYKPDRAEQEIIYTMRVFVERMMDFYGSLSALNAV